LAGAIVTPTCARRKVTSGTPPLQLRRRLTICFRIATAIWNYGTIEKTTFAPAELSWNHLSRTITRTRTSEMPVLAGNCQS
jgi:hypothetical protein